MECVVVAPLKFPVLTQIRNYGGNRFVRKCGVAAKRLECLRLRVRAAAGGGGGSEGCVAVKEGFADEEDFVKAGGSELMFVQMQKNKEMELQQSRLSDKACLPLIHSFAFLAIEYLFLTFGCEK